MTVSVLLWLWCCVAVAAGSAPSAESDCRPVALLAYHATELARAALAAELGPDAAAATVAELTDWSLARGRQSRPRSCLQLQQANGSLPDGVYRLAGLEQPVYCDFSHDGGGWTLLLTAATRDGWDLLNIRLRDAAAPSLTDNYSILGRGDALKALGTGGRFAYRLEVQAQTGRQQWGGIWLAPRHYTFTPETDGQRDIALVRKFSSWTYGKDGIQQAMPWLNVAGHFEGHPLLTTTVVSSKNWWGTLITQASYGDRYNHSAWIKKVAEHSGTILYWMREEELP